MSDFLDLNPANLEQEHLCCALAGKQAEGVARKKEFLAKGMKGGMIFRKLNVRGKVFIEYAPSEAAFRPVEAPGYLVIHCLWVSGRFKAQGWGRELLLSCQKEVGSRNGIVAVTGRQSWLTSTDFYLRHGFECIQTTAHGFDLVCFKTKKNAADPKFASAAARGRVRQNEGVHFEFVYQCPFVPSCLRNMSSAAQELGLPVSSRQFRTPKSVRRAGSPFGTFGVFLFGDFLTHKMMTKEHFLRLLEKNL